MELFYLKGYRARLLLLSMNLASQKNVCDLLTHTRTYLCPVVTLSCTQARAIIILSVTWFELIMSQSVHMDDDDLHAYLTDYFALHCNPRTESTGRLYFADFR